MAIRVVRENGDEIAPILVLAVIFCGSVRV